MPANLETIDVRLNSADKWQMRLNHGDWEDYPNYPDIVINRDDVGVLTYRIVGSGGVKFHDVQPFVEKSRPGNPPSDFLDQFKVYGAGTRELTIIDINGKDNSNYPGGTYNYELRFAGPPNTTVPPLDPIITNMGCCRAIGLSGAEAVAYSLLIATAGALVAVGYRKWRART
jgi:hypothetical protein